MIAGRIARHKPGERICIYRASTTSSIFVLLKQLQLPCFGCGASLRRHRHMLKWHAVEGGQVRHGAVIRNDERNLADQLAGAPAVQQIGHAVQVLRAEERHPRPARARGELPRHLELGGQRRKGGAEALEVEAVQLPLHAHEKQAQLMVLVLVGVQDVGATLVEQARNARHQSLAVGAIDQ